MDTNIRVVLMREKRKIECVGEISGSHGDEYENGCPLDVAPCSLEDIG
jgi:hypothetical protein